MYCNAPGLEDLPQSTGHSSVLAGCRQEPDSCPGLASEAFQADGAVRLCLLAGSRVRGLER
eukprot:6842084-Alexandrium_andersonii.AAC.1